MEAAASTSVQEPSAPVAEVKQTAEEGDIQEAPKEADKAEEGKEEKPEPTEAEKVKMAMQKRIDRQTAASKALQERTRQLEQELESLKANAPKADDAPKQEDFDNYDDYEKALVEHRAKKIADERIAQAKEQELKETQERRAAEIRRDFDNKEQAFRTSTPDYDSVAKEAVETMTELATAGHNISIMRDLVMQFDNPPEMIYQLGKDTSLIEELVGMQPLQAMRELVKLEIALKSAVKTETQQAPAPIKPVSGKGGVKPLHEQSGEQILKWAKGK